MKYVMLIPALHYRFSTPSTAIYCRYPSDPVYKYLPTHTTAKYDQLDLEIWLACHDSASCLYLYTCIYSSISSSIHLYAHLSIYMPIYVSLRLSTPLLICIFCLSVRFPVSLSLRLYVLLCICLSIHPTIYPSIHPTVDLLKIRNSVSFCDRNSYFTINICPIFSTCEISVLTRENLSSRVILNLFTDSHVEVNNSVVVK
jgi:hypothetical protein